MTAPTVVVRVPVRVQLPGCAEIRQVFELHWNRDKPDLAALATGRHPVSGVPTLWTFAAALLARGLRGGSDAADSGYVAELEVNDPRWLMLAAVDALVGVLLPVAFVERFLTRVHGAQVAALDWAVEEANLLGRAA